jgi:phosphohistidine phosphatase SixA
LTLEGHAAVQQTVMATIYAKNPSGAALICTSSAQRAVESADVAAEVLRANSLTVTTAEPTGYLWSEDNYLWYGQVNAAKQAIDQLVGSVDYGLVVVVSHYELAPHLVSAFGATDWKPRFGMIGPGDGIIVCGDSWSYARF